MDTISDLNKNKPVFVRFNTCEYSGNSWQYTLSGHVNPDMICNIQEIHGTIFNTARACNVAIYRVSLVNRETFYTDCEIFKKLF